MTAVLDRPERFRRNPFPGYEPTSAVKILRLGSAVYVEGFGMRHIATTTQGGGQPVQYHLHEPGVVPPVGGCSRRGLGCELGGIDVVEGDPTVHPCDQMIEEQP